MPGCAALAYVPADARTDIPRIAARITVAMCAAGTRMNALTLRDDAASKAALEKAVAPTLAVLDDLARNGNPDAQIVASHLRGELFIAMSVRLRNAIPPLAGTTGAPMLALQERHNEVERDIAPWLADASLSFDRVHRIAAEHHYSTNDPVVAAAVRRSATEIVARIP